MVKIAISLLLSLAYIFNFKVGYNQYTGLDSHIFFVLSHANIFHLICNLLALWSIKGKLYVIPALIINFVASIIPPVINDSFQLTYGASGVLFAIVGIKWGQYFIIEYCKGFVETDYGVLEKNILRFCGYVLIPLIITAFIPNINWSLHFYTLALGVWYGISKYVITDGFIKR